MPLLTDASVRNAKPPAPGPAGENTRIDLWDEAIPGFGLRVASTGAKSWVVGVRLLRDGKRVFTRVSLGSYPAMSLAEAREKAREAKLLAAQHKDPRETKARQLEQALEASRNTFGRLVEEFLAKHVERRGLRASTIRDYRLVLQGRDVAAWKDRPVASLTRRDVLETLDTVMDRGAPSAAIHLLAALRPFMQWCFDREIIQQIPTDRVKSSAPVPKRDRALSAEELAEVWAAIGAFEDRTEGNQRGDLFGPLLKLLVLTGQRREEVAGMRWAELKLEGAEPVWEIPGERTKNHRPHIVPLAPAAATILRQMTKIKGSPFVFTTSGTTHVSGFSKAKSALDDVIAERRKSERTPGTLAPFVIHDLRRTVSTRMHEDLGIAPHVVEAVLNHVSGFRAGVAGTYNRAQYLDEKRRALVAWAGFIQRLGKYQTRSNVVALGAGKRVRRG